MKPIMKKYINESHHIYTIDRLLGFLAVGNIDILIRFDFALYGTYYFYRRQDEFIMNILKELVLVYLKHGIRRRERYFNFNKIQGYVIDGFYGKKF